MEKRRIAFMPLIAVPILYVWHNSKPGLDYLSFQLGNFFKSKRRTYQDEVFRLLGMMACMDRRGPVRALHDNTTMRSLVDMCFADKMPSGRTAMFIAARVQSNFVDSFNAGRRSLVYEQLQKTNAGEIGSALKQMQEEKLPDHPEGLAHETIVVGLSLFMAKTFLDEGKINQSELDMFTSEVLCALAGVGPEQRKTVE